MNDINNFYDMYVLEIPNSLTKELCEEIMKNLITDKNVYEGVTGSGLQKKTKRTTDLNLTRYENWKYYDNILSQKLTEGIRQLKTHIENKLEEYNLNKDIVNTMNIFNYNIEDTGYLLMKYEANDGFYNWHNDGHNGFNIKNGDFKYEKVSRENKPCIRHYTFLWYLNDVTDGGETYFLHKKVKAEQGKLLLFPAHVIYPHKGSMPLSNNKYICTGWIFI